MAEKISDFGSELQHVAVRSFLSTVVAISECLAEICPEVGLAFRNRWRRLPQRLAFDLSARELEVSRQAFEKDIQTFGRFTQQYLNEGLPLIASVAATGSSVLETVLDRTASYTVLLETLADSMESSADLDSANELRKSLEHQAAGLRSCARQAEMELIPLITRVRDLVRDCERVLQQTQASVVVDGPTGFLNAAGFLEHLEAELGDGLRKCCVLLIDFTATANSEPCGDHDFSQIVPALAARIAEQFRPTDSIGRHDRKFAVLFAGRLSQAQGRQEQITRSISGNYAAGARKVVVKAQIQITECETATLARDFFGLSPVAAMDSEPALAAVEPVVANGATAHLAPFEETDVVGHADAPSATKGSSMPESEASAPTFEPVTIAV